MLFSLFLPTVSKITQHFFICLSRKANSNKCVKTNPPRFVPFFRLCVRAAWPLWQCPPLTQMRNWCWPGPDWIAQVAFLTGPTLVLHPQVHLKRRTVPQPKWMTSSRSAEKAMQWLFAYGWTIQRMTSIKGELEFTNHLCPSLAHLEMQTRRNHACSFFFSF